MSNQCSDTGKIMQTVSVEFCPREGCDGVMHPRPSATSTSVVIAVCGKCGYGRH